MGTLAYFSPEQARGEQADARSDIYSLGATFFEMLTGRLVFEATSAAAMIDQVVNLAAPSPRVYVASIPATLEALLARCLCKKPEDRFQTVKSLADALEAWMGHGAAASGAVPAPPETAKRQAGPSPGWMQSVENAKASLPVAQKAPVPFFKAPAPAAVVPPAMAPPAPAQAPPVDPPVIPPPAPPTPVQAAGEPAGAVWGRVAQELVKAHKANVVPPAVAPEKPSLVGLVAPPVAVEAKRLASGKYRV
jgi:serine/threonine-protein kinase